MAKRFQIEISPDLKSLYRDTAEKLRGTERRQFMAQLVKQWGWGGYTFAEKELGWNRRTIRKGMMELDHGLSIADSFRLRGRQPIEEKLPDLLSDIHSVIEPYCQTDPSFQSTKLYTRISVAKVRSLLIEEKGYTSRQLPSNETIRTRLNEMGYRLKRVQKRNPKKKIPETAAIFEQINQVNQEADDEPYTLRISMDAKVAVNVGKFDRGGKTRVTTIAEDHDFNPECKITPYGIFLPQHNELNLFFVSSKLTADCIVDLLEDWWKEARKSFPPDKKIGN